jgi:hypothetical protein
MEKGWLICLHEVSIMPWCTARALLGPSAMFAMGIYWYVVRETRYVHTHSRCDQGNPKSASQCKATSASQHAASLPPTPPSLNMARHEASRILVT